MSVTPRRFVLRLAVLSLACAAIAGVSWSVGAEAGRREATADSASIPPTTAEIVELQLVETLLLRGDVLPQDRFTVAPPPPRDSMSIMTRDVIDEGQLVHEGDVVAEIALRPVIVLAGPIPVFRDLGPDSVGQDVRQLEQALERLGHFPATPDDRFDPVTSAALARLYDSLGYAAPGGPSSSAPASEIVVVPSLPRRAEVVTTMTGRPVEGPLLALATEAVDVILSAEDAGLLPEMVPVETYISDPSIVETISLSPVGGTASVNGIPSALRPDKPIPQRLVGRNVAVTMRFALTDGAVIAVPVSGVRSGLGDSTYVQVAREGRTRRVDVELGVAADGYVEVASSSSVLRVGDTVVVGS